MVYFKDYKFRTLLSRIRATRKRLHAELIGKSNPTNELTWNSAQEQLYDISITTLMESIDRWKKLTKEYWAHRKIKTPQEQADQDKEQFSQFLNEEKLLIINEIESIVKEKAQKKFTPNAIQKGKLNNICLVQRTSGYAEIDDLKQKKLADKIIIARRKKRRLYFSIFLIVFFLVSYLGLKFFPEEKFDELIIRYQDSKKLLSQLIGTLKEIKEFIDSH